MLLSKSVFTFNGAPIDSVESILGRQLKVSFTNFSGKKSYRGQNGSGPRSAGADHLLQGGRGLGPRDQILPQTGPDGPAEVGEEAGGRQRSGLEPSMPYSEEVELNNMMFFKGISHM